MEYEPLESLTDEQNQFRKQTLHLIHEIDGDTFAKVSRHVFGPHRKFKNDSEMNEKTIHAVERLSPQKLEQLVSDILS